MIYIFHGDDQQGSREAFNALLDSLSGTDLLRLDAKEIDYQKVYLYINSTSLLPQPKAIALSGFFSLTKTAADKLLPVLNGADATVALWQDKNLTLAQLKAFPGAKISQFKGDNRLYACLNAVKPKNVAGFSQSYQYIIDSGLFDLFLYLLKGSLRRQLSTYSRFPEESLRKTYLQLIELDYLNKSGTLSLPREIALERIIINLIK